MDLFLHKRTSLLLRFIYAPRCLLQPRRNDLFIALIRGKNRYCTCIKYKLLFEYIILYSMSREFLLIILLHNCVEYSNIWLSCSLAEKIWISFFIVFNFLLGFHCTIIQTKFMYTMPMGQAYNRHTPNEVNSISWNRKGEV